MKGAGLSHRRHGHKNALTCPTTGKTSFYPIHDVPQNRSRLYQAKIRNFPADSIQLELTHRILAVPKERHMGVPVASLKLETLPAQRVVQHCPKLEQGRRWIRNSGDKYLRRAKIFSTIQNEAEWCEIDGLRCGHRPTQTSIILVTEKFQGQVQMTPFKPASWQKRDSAPRLIQDGARCRRRP
jgi:hypothetical protein